VRFFGINKY